MSRESKFSATDTLNSVDTTETNLTNVNTFELLKFSLLMRNHNLQKCPNFSSASIQPVLVPEGVAIDFKDYCFSTKYFLK